MSVFVQEYVIRFDVAVDDAYFMQALNGEELDGTQNISAQETCKCHGIYSPVELSRTGLLHGLYVVCVLYNQPSRHADRKAI